MILRSERIRQIIFLVLVISGTIVFYCSKTQQLVNKDRSEFVKQRTELNMENINNLKDAENYFGIFINNPNSEYGVDALFFAVEYWDGIGKDSLIQNAVNKFEKIVHNDSLKNRFYSHLGRYYIDTNRHSKSQLIDKILLGVNQ